MPTFDLLTLLLVLIFAAATGGLLVWLILRKLARSRKFPDRIVVQQVIERVRAVGRLVGLEVYAKEIATVSAGWSWLPPLLLSQARLAMIFHFEKQYFIDLARITPGDVVEIGGGPTSPARFRITLPPIQGTLRLIDVSPYDIQSGRVMGLLDVIPMNAERQAELMRKAQQQAGQLYEHNDARYHIEARRSIERHVKALLDLFGVSAEVVWSDEEERESARLSSEVSRRRSSTLPA